MNQGLEKAKELLNLHGFQYVLSDGIAFHSTNKEGYSSLLTLYSSGIDLRDFSLAARQIGLADAYLAVALGIKSVHAEVISSGALSVLSKAKAEVKYDELKEAVDGALEDVLKEGLYPGQALLIIKNAGK